MYLDYGATTPVDPEVLAEMLPHFTQSFGNPSSRMHSLGWSAGDAVEQARERVSRLLGCQPREIYFTSGATESNMTALWGLGRAEHARTRRHIVSSPIEHKSVISCLEALEQQGFAVTRVRPRPDGRTLVEDILDAKRPDTLFVSLMWVNNEIGVINPLPELARALKLRFPEVIVHCDATQAVGKLPVDLGESPIDLLSLSAHKLYGPKGVGALFIREAIQDKIAPVMRGGGQERGVRGGTLNAPGIVGLGKAAEIAAARLAEDSARIQDLTRRLYGRLCAGFPGVVVNGSMSSRAPGNLSVAFPGISAERLLKALGEVVAVSSGSACASGSSDVSHVLRGIGLPDELARATIRFSVGRPTTVDQIESAASAILAALATLEPVAPPAPEHERRDRDDMRLQPIGKVVNAVREPQYIEWRKTLSRVVVDDRWAAALDGLAEYSHVIVVYWMDQVVGCKLTHVPQANFREVPEVGMFACRCPYRPNPIAVTVARLLEIDNLELIVEGLDAVNETPVIDIKPYTPQMDGVEGEVRVPGWVDKLVY